MDVNELYATGGATGSIIAAVLALYKILGSKACKSRCSVDAGDNHIVVSIGAPSPERPQGASPVAAGATGVNFNIYTSVK